MKCEEFFKELLNKLLTSLSSKSPDVFTVRAVIDWGDVRIGELEKVETMLVMSLKFFKFKKRKFDIYEISTCCKEDVGVGVNGFSYVFDLPIEELGDYGIYLGYSCEPIKVLCRDIDEKCFNILLKRFEDFLKDPTNVFTWCRETVPTSFPEETKVSAFYGDPKFVTYVGFEKAVVSKGVFRHVLAAALTRMLVSE